MASLVSLYIVLPFALAALVLTFIRRFGAGTPAAVRDHLARHPILPKWFRLARLQGGGLRDKAAVVTKIEDFDAQDKAVDAAHLSKSQVSGSYLVLNDKGEVLQQV